MLAHQLAHVMKFFHLFDMKHVAKFVPKVLNFEQEKRQMEIAQKSLNEVNNDIELLKHVITGDETWVYGYDVKTRAQLSQWRHSGSPRLKKV